MHFFEALMLICFGAAWPMNIYKSLKSRTAGGKSLFFSVVIIIGYISGIINKYLYSRDFVMYLYVLNLIMISIDLVLYFRNRKLDIEREQASKAAAGK